MNLTNWQEVKIHCSALYNIMTDGRSKSNLDLYKEACDDLTKKEEQLEKLIKKSGPRGETIREAIEKLKVYIPILEAGKDEDIPLSAGCKSHLSGIYAFEKYHKWSPFKDIGSRATEKGKFCEQDGIELVNKKYSLNLFKNEERRYSDFFSGHLDAFEGEDIDNVTVVHDVKCPDNVETFFSYLNKDLPPVYYWQMQGYMNITGASVAKVHFCLVNTPDHQIKHASEALLRRMDVISDLSPEYVEAQYQLVKNLTYDDINPNDKVYTFVVERNDDDIQKACLKVQRCREYLQEFEKIHLGIE